jgi:hypothetical protein
MGTVKSKGVKGAQFFSEGGRVRGAGETGATISGRDRVAPMIAADEIASGKASSRRSAGGQGGSGAANTRGLGERIAGGINAIATGKRGQKRTMDDDAATRARNTKK